MRKLDCRDVVAECDMVYTGADDDEVVRLAAAHLRRSHLVDADGLVEQLRASVVPLV